MPSGQTLDPIAPGIYSIAEILARCGIEVDDAYDRRRIRVGGLGFDYLDETFRLPDSAEQLEVTLDGTVHTVFPVEQ